MTIASPTGYHLMLPPGWRGFPVDDDGLAQVQRFVSARFRAIGRPDLDAQMRQLLRQQWAALRAQLARQVFLRAEQDERMLLPMSIAVRQFVAPPPATFEQALATTTGTTLERFDTPAGPWFRGEREQRGQGELSMARSVTVLYGMPLPEPHQRKGLAFIGSVTHADGTDAELVRGHVELLDTIMETVRWR
ncbi:hypothetical protein [Agrococcus carbonis]|uniref:Uncharacterized protein n=1 Tax=Agrococcus carbonis TaxID=684552 RepID=A0A1H1QHG4_9MICO|nr:hypothetical protein [Agrococcus carbonis]SDS22971.1 hypothetical protein SAMN04489719_1841 [Agrococcus carbonis]